ncbi:DUF397 domain-containing protein [Kitasatospora sp. GAS206B]|uniref:DUF397 domain-containing protein n=1 Tax=unclassified Kitasatospora TaxID=2633591 RepID=UPI0035129D34
MLRRPGSPGGGDRHRVRRGQLPQQRSRPTGRATGSLTFRSAVGRSPSTPRGRNLAAASSGKCVEAAPNFPGAVPVRDSKDPSGGALLRVRHVLLSSVAVVAASVRRADRMVRWRRPLPGHAMVWTLGVVLRHSHGP